MNCVHYVNIYPIIAEFSISSEVCQSNLSLWDEVYLVELLCPNYKYRFIYYAWYIKVHNYSYLPDETA
jgi:hypothetical protein